MQPRVEGLTRCAQEDADPEPTVPSCTAQTATPSRARFPSITPVTSLYLQQAWEPPGVTQREGQPCPAQCSLGTNFRENTQISSDQMERGLQCRPSPEH